MLHIASIVVCLAACASAYGGPNTQQTGHTGLKYDQTSIITIPGFKRVEGAMIPRQCQVGVIVQPKTENDIVSALKDAKAKCDKTGHKLNIRASRQLYHASSDILCPEASSSTPADCSVLLDMQQMTYWKLDKDKQEVTAGPAVLLYTLMNELEKAGYTLEQQNLPFYSNLTVAGMLLTGAHGSSRTSPSSFGHIVREVTFIDALGQTHTTQNVKPLIGSNGLFGIVTQLVIKVVPLYKLMAVARRWHDYHLRQELKNILADPELALIQWLPDVKQAVVMTRKKVPAYYPGRAEFQVLDRNLILAAGAGPAIGINQLDNALLGNHLLLDDLPVCLAEVVLIPYFRGEFTRIPIPFGKPAIGRNAVMATSNCVPGPNFGCLWRVLSINLLELDLPLDKLPDWMDDVRRVIAKSVPTCLPSVIGFAMRFGQGSDAPLDMAYGRDTVYVDLVSDKAAYLVDAPSSYQHVFDEIEQLSFCKYGARPHWGKNSNRAFANSRCPPIDKYPRAQEVVSQAKQYDPEGVFVPPLLKLVLDRKSLPKTPGCAVRAECYCDSDEDCGPHYACITGDSFPEFKVCKSQVLSLKNDMLARVRDALTFYP